MRIMLKKLTQKVVDHYEKKASCNCQPVESDPCCSPDKEKSSQCCVPKDNGSDKKCC